MTILAPHNGGARLPITRLHSEMERCEVDCISVALVAAPKKVVSGPTNMLQLLNAERLQIRDCLTLFAKHPGCESHFSSLIPISTMADGSG